MNEHDWDQVAETFEEEIFNVPAHDSRGLINEHVKRLARPGAVVTDLGCGVGRTLPHLASLYHMVHAVDVSSRCLVVAERACAAHGNIRYVQCDLSRGRQGYPVADVVLCINTWLNAAPAIRAGIIDTTCRSIKRGGHLILVVPSVESALLTTCRHVQWNRRDGMDPGKAQRAAAMDTPGVEHGIIHIEGAPTKHYLAEELTALLEERGLAAEVMEKLEYPWRTEFKTPPKWMKAPYPWDWFVVARRLR
ncbi:MAG: class I SAM-dependent methyltransferase [Flavobacteriales bacterium]|nr:class I SAM-dependent methyltransferase [Flavobacteriales bacterium]